MKEFRRSRPADSGTNRRSRESHPSRALATAHSGGDHRLAVVAETEKYRDEDEVYKMKIDAKNRLENYCCAARNFHTEEKFKVKFEAEPRRSVRRMLLDQVAKNPLAEKDEFEAKQKELRVVGKVVHTFQGAQETVARKPHSSSSSKQQPAKQAEQKREQEEERKEGRETRKGEAEPVRGSGIKQVAEDVTDWVEVRRRTMEEGRR